MTETKVTVTPVANDEYRIIAGETYKVTERFSSDNSPSRPDVSSVDTIIEDGRRKSKHVGRARLISCDP
jgi:hypothetical protein